MKRIVGLIISVFVLVLLVSCGGGYKECKSVIADKVSLYSNETIYSLCEFSNDNDEINKIYAVATYVDMYNITTLTYKNKEYTKGSVVGEFYYSKVVIKYNEKEKKAIKIEEYNLNKSLSSSIYSYLQNNEAFVSVESLQSARYYSNTSNNYSVNASKLVSRKAESNYDLSGSPTIQYVYA